MPNEGQEKRQYGGRVTRGPGDNSNVHSLATRPIAQAGHEHLECRCGDAALKSERRVARDCRPAKSFNNQPRPDAATSFNNQLRVTAVAIGGASADGHEYGFLCECGCGETVRLDLAEYDLRGGAWLDRHEPGIHTDLERHSDPARTRLAIPR